MKNLRFQVTLGLFAYLFLCSVFFGVVFSKGESVTSLGIGFLCLAGAQAIALWILIKVMENN